MDRTPHQIVNPLTLSEPVGFSHALVVSPGRIVHVGGQAARRHDGKVMGDGVAEQFDRALGNVIEALRAAHAEPFHVVEMRIYTTVMHAYRVSSNTIGSVYRRHMGRHYPPMTVIGIDELMDPDALVEIVCTAVVPEVSEEAALEDEETRELLEEIEESADDTVVIGRPGAEGPEEFPERSPA
ncbi:RidA family protein [Nocardiopsis lambiniae]|uniref:RidA family protein n=1 Tax=Nocardiopsis lambiniae TaxID=3075539 RepID=A0ABU2MB80_9ACTN|nr:RidA family protein [Nocardiopsis sp. DSM 44743]MDT0329943.1 RidA family protein [Nocardiopsis sp. DSM 44743]